MLTDVLFNTIADIGMRKLEISVPSSLLDLKIIP